jgi:hypothetical protein
MSSGGPARTYLVECYWPGVNEEELTKAVRRARDAAAELRQLGAQVDFVGSILVPVDETVFCLFDGSEADVREASERAGVPFERVLESLRIDGSLQREEEED